jgi:hypothetical protein
VSSRISSRQTSASSNHEYTATQQSEELLLCTAENDEACFGISSKHSQEREREFVNVIGMEESASVNADLGTQLADTKSQHVAAQDDRGCLPFVDTSCRFLSGLSSLCSVPSLEEICPRCKEKTTHAKKVMRLMELLEHMPVVSSPHCVATQNLRNFM